MPAGFTLGKTERLKSRKAIGRVFDEGQKLVSGNLRVHYLLLKEPGTPGSLRMAVSVSSRNFRKATDRNRIKRLIREAWRVQKNHLREMVAGGMQLSVFIIFTGKEKATYAGIREDVAAALRKLEKNIGKSN